MHIETELLCILYSDNKLEVYFNVTTKGTILHKTYKKIINKYKRGTGHGEFLYWFAKSLYPFLPYLVYEKKRGWYIRHLLK